MQVCTLLCTVGRQARKTRSGCDKLPDCSSAIQRPLQASAQCGLRQRLFPPADTRDWRNGGSVHICSSNASGVMRLRRPRRPHGARPPHSRASRQVSHGVPSNGLRSDAQGSCGEGAASGDCPSPTASTSLRQDADDANLDAAFCGKKGNAPSRALHTQQPSRWLDSSKGHLHTGSLPCNFCGQKVHAHSECPASGVKCFNFNNYGQFVRVCKKPQQGHQNRLSISSVQQVSNTWFLDSIGKPDGNKSQFTEVTVNSVPLSAKIDPGGEVSAVPASFCGVRRHLGKAEEFLTGPREQRLNVLGKFCVELRWNDRVLSRCFT